MKSYTRGFIAVFFSIFLAGCLQNQVKGPTPLFPPPDETIPTGSLPKDTVNQTQVDCSLKPYLDNGSIPTEFAQFALLSYCGYAQKNLDFPKWQVDFIDKGIALANQTCDIFFNKLESQRSGLSYQQGNMNIIGSAVTAALAVSTQHSRAIFNAAVALTAGNAWFENYRSNYILTPDLQKLSQKIQTSLRDPLAEKMKEKSLKAEYRSFGDAKTDIQKYDNLCSPLVLQYIVSLSVETSELKPFAASTSLTESKEALALMKVIYARALNLPVDQISGNFSSGEFEYIYVIVTPPSGTTRLEMAKAAKYLIDSGSTSEKGIGVAVDALFITNPKITDADLYSITQIGSLLQYGKSNHVNSLRNTVVAAIASIAEADDANKKLDGANARVSNASEKFLNAQKTLDDASRALQASPSPVVDGSANINALTKKKNDAADEFNVAKREKEKLEARVRNVDAQLLTLRADAAILRRAASPVGTVVGTSNSISFQYSVNGVNAR